MRGSAVLLAEAVDARRFGGKAAGLAVAIAHRLPVPGGVALDVDLVSDLARRVPYAVDACAAVVASFGGARLAVRSSAAAEDGAAASFAGQHLTRLGVASLDDVLEAIAAVRASAESSSAIAYRDKLGLPGDASIGVVLQRIVDAECSGVMFTRCPVSGADERVIEAAWGLGEVVVAGRVVPDRFRLARGGAVLEALAGDKDVILELDAVSGTVERAVRSELRARPCLDPARLAALEDLAAKCDAAYRTPSDTEWAFEGARLHLLQRRAVTR